ncbi:C39 family peptidase [Candidatus Woesearchaeota archaeon]|nr:C39 family peptidase [Candidatus Woesearchaeota archaeon]
MKAKQEVLEKILDVPRIKQQYAEGCGPTVLSMILQYHGDDVTEEYILEALGGIVPVSKESRGTFVTDRASFARSRGYAVACYIHNTALLPASLEGKRPSELSRVVSALVQQADGISKHILLSYDHLLRHGVDLRMRRPDIVDVRNFLERGMPVDVSVHSRTFFCDDHFPIHEGHSIAVTGFSGHIFRVNDPSSGQQQSITAEDLSVAMTNYAFNHSAYLITLRRSGN